MVSCKIRKRRGFVCLNVWENKKNQENQNHTKAFILLYFIYLKKKSPQLFYTKRVILSVIEAAPGFNGTLAARFDFRTACHLRGGHPNYISHTKHIV